MNIDTLLIAVGNEGNDRRKSIPLALPTLKSILKEAGFTSKCIDASDLNTTHDVIKSWIEQFNPKVIGISATAYEINSVAHLTTTIKSISVEIPVILGGYISLLPDVIEKTNVDAVCLGEGDQTIVDLVEVFSEPFLEWGQRLSQVNGIRYYNEKENQVVQTPPRLLIENLDSIPLPDYSDFDLSQYGNGVWLPFYSQRGCYNFCNFCDIIPFYGDQRVRSMSPSRVVEFLETSHLSKSVSYFLFTDDNFMSNEKYLKGLVREITSRNLLGKIWINFQTRANDILRFKDILSEMKPFIFSIELGVESFSDSQLKRFKKNVTRKQNLEAIDFLVANDIPVNLYYMFLDNETTPKELEENVQTILSLPDMPQFNIPQPLPEIVSNYQYSVLCNRTGEPTIKGIDFLETFDYFLTRTEDIRKVFVLYRMLKKVEGDPEVQKDLSDFQKRFLSSLAIGIGPKIVEIGRKRLEIALEYALNFHKRSKKFRPGKHRKMEKQISANIEDVKQILQPLSKFGVDFDQLTQNF